MSLKSINQNQSINQESMVYDIRNQTLYLMLVMVYLLGNILAHGGALYLRLFLL